MIRSLLGQWLATGYVAMVSLVVTFVIGRVLGVGLFADYSYVISIVYIYLMVIEGGYKTLIFREETRKSDAETVFDVDGISALAVGHVIVTLVIGWVLVSFLPMLHRAALLSALAFMALFALTGVVSSRLKGKGRFSREAVWQSAVRTLSAAGMIAGLLLGRGDISWIFVGGIVGMGLSLILPLRSGIIPRPSFSFSGGIYRQVLVFLSIDAATQIYFRSDIVVLKYLCPDSSQVGNYAAAARLLGGVVLLLAPLGQICFRRLRLLEDARRFYRSLWFETLLMAVAGVAVLGAVYWGANFIVAMTFGADYRPAAGMLTGLTVALLFMFPNTILTQGAIAINREGWYAVAAGLGALLNVIMNLFLVPERGAMGAIIATVFTEFFLFLFLSVLLFVNSKKAIAVAAER